LADIFTTIILKLQEMGAFNFLFPFMLTTAIFYGLLRKSKIFMVEKKEFRTDKDGNKEEITVETGTSVNAVIALVAGFLVWAYPILMGVDIEQEFSRFFMQSMIVTLIFIVTLMIIGMILPPDVPSQIGDALQGKPVLAVLVIALVLGVVIFIMSGLLNLIVGPLIVRLNITNDLLLTIVVLILLVAPLIFVFREGGGSQSSGGGNSGGSDS
jgi:hypothetical protein